MARIISTQRTILTGVYSTCSNPRRAPTRRSRAAQRHALNVTAFTSEDETVSISFDGYNLLQASFAVYCKLFCLRLCYSLSAPISSSAGQQGSKQRDMLKEV